MSLWQTSLIIIAVILVIVAFLGFFIYKRQINNKLVNFQAKVNNFEFTKIDLLMEKIEKMSLSGESLTTFATWRDAIASIREEKIPQINDAIVETDDFIVNNRLFLARKSLSQAESVADDVQSDLENAKHVFEELLQTNKDNEQQRDELIEIYQSLRKQILTDSYKYGLALDRIEDKLTEIENNFDLISEMTEQGDHVEAKRILKKVNLEISELQNILPIVEKANAEIEIEFPGQLDEISDSYKKMMAQDFNFSGDDILDEIKDLRRQVNKSKLLHENLSLDDLTANNTLIEDQIDILYDRLTNEITSKKQVLKEENSLENAIQHVEYQSEKLITKLDHIDQSYHLTHNELGEVKAVAKEIAQLKSDFVIDQDKIEAKKAVYSDVLIDFGRVNDRITAIDSRLEAIDDDINGMFEAERIAKNSVVEMAQEVNLIKRKIDRRKLPGLPAEFVDFYQVILGELKDLNEELGKVRIDLEQIASKLILVKEDINRLRIEADEIINSANLVEQTLQYANKYVGNPEVKKAMDEATAEFSNGFQYKDGLDKLAAELEKVELGAYNRIENDYYKQKNN